MKRKVSYISNIGGSIAVTFNDGEGCVFHKFGKTIYTTTTPGVLKKTLVELKKDVKNTDFNIEQLRRLWVEK